MLKLNTKNVINKIKVKQLKKYQSTVNNIIKLVDLKALPGGEFLGWMDLVDSYDSHELMAMKQKANAWEKFGIKYVVVIGIGGSYTGVRAAIDMCLNQFDSSGPEVIWVHNMAASYLLALRSKLAHKKFAIIVISKSGTTLEPALGFKIFRELLIKNVGISKMHKYTVAITDKENGTLHDYAIRHHIPRFVVPNGIGGRFSTLTPVGMFLIILKGLDPLQVIRGAKKAKSDTQDSDLRNNSAFLYACYRNYLNTSIGLQIENFIVYEPDLQFVGEMWRQMFGESEGKNGKGIYPTLSLFTTDLHSMGQFMQEGTNNFFETTLLTTKPKKDMIMKVNDNEDGLRYLNRKSIDLINKKAIEATVQAHTQIGNRNNIIIEISSNDEFHFGYLFYWFAMAVMMSGYLLKINPFNQPGVEQYKNNMFKLLGKRK